MRFIVLTLFPNMFEAFVNTSIIKRTIDKDICSIEVIDIRKFTKDKHNRVDFPPFGGGRGMILSCQPLAAAIDFSIEKLKSKSKKDVDIIYLSPRGKVLNYNLCKDIASSDKNYILICGHYEGIDQRVLDKIVDEEISIGDYVLTGGEIPAMVLIDSVSRYIEGVLKKDSIQEESFSNGLLEYPQYTRPEIFEGERVPEILLSGHHENIDKWRKEQSLKITKQKRPDLIKRKKENT